MVYFDKGSTVSSNSNSRSHRRRSPSHRSHSRSNSNNMYKHQAPSVHSVPSNYNYAYGSDSNVNAPSAVSGRKSPSVYSGTAAASSTRRRAKPRKGFVKRVVRTIRQVLRDIYDYAREFPYRTFFMVIVPLIATGVLQKLLGFIGIKLPKRIFGRLAKPPSFDGLKAHVIALIRVAKWAVKS